MHPFHSAVHTAESALEDVRRVHGEGSINRAQLALASARKQTKDEASQGVLMEASQKLEFSLDPKGDKIRATLVNEAIALVGTLHGGIHIKDPH